MEITLKAKVKQLEEYLSFKMIFSRNLSSNRAGKGYKVTE